MFTVQSTVRVPGIRARQVVDFLLRCTDGEYRQWWPGTHLHFHTLWRHPNDIGNVVYMDEIVGKRRLRLKGVVTEVIPGKKLVWQFRLVVPQPVRLVLEAEDEPGGVRITHTVCAGFEGIGRILDPLFRLYLSDEFRRALDAHVKAEFPRLGVLLTTTTASATPSAAPA